MGCSPGALERSAGRVGAEWTDGGRRRSGALWASLARPGSERATWGWLGRRSEAWAKLLDLDFETLSLMQLYRASDATDETKDRQAMRPTCSPGPCLFDLQPTVTLFGR